MKIFSTVLMAILTTVIINTTTFAADNTSLADELESNIVFADKEKNEASNMKLAATMTIRGTEYYKGMSIIEKKEQLDYTLKIDEFAVDNQRVKLSGSIFNQSGSIAEISDEGLLYKSQRTILQKFNGLTILFPRKESLQIISCTLEKNAFDGELMIANAEMAGKPVIKIAVQNKNKIYYFEGELPVGFDYDGLYAAAKNPSEETKIAEIDKRFTIGDGSVSEYEIIQYEEGWKTEKFPLPNKTTEIAAKNTPLADELNQLGLFMGTGNGYELESTLTREQAATMLVRLKGEEKNVKDYAAKEIFDDVKSDRWSFPYVMYCYDNSITKGTSESTFSPSKKISAAEFITLVLRLIGFDAEPENAYSKAVTVGLINSEAARELSEKDEFTRGDMVYIAHRSLKTQTPDGECFAEKLSESGAITEKQALKFDVYSTEDDIDGLLDALFN